MSKRHFFPILGPPKRIFKFHPLFVHPRPRKTWKPQHPEGFSKRSAAPACPRVAKARISYHQATASPDLWGLRLTAGRRQKQTRQPELVLWLWLLLLWLLLLLSLSLSLLLLLLSLSSLFFVVVVVVAVVVVVFLVWCYWRFGGCLSLPLCKTGAGTSGVPAASFIRRGLTARVYVAYTEVGRAILHIEFAQAREASINAGNLCYNQR